MASLKPIKLYSHAGGPNPWKVAIILEELGVPYDTEIMAFDKLKQEPFESVNPNGRVPAIEDPNTGISLWESGAIIEYLLDEYDKNHSLVYTSGAERYQTQSWLHFQMSGQGPYWGQRAWFTFYHPEKNLTSAIDRYGNEIRRTISVIDKHLQKHNRQYLVGDKLTYADLAFQPWHFLVLQPPFMMGEDFPAEWEREYPHAWAWQKRVSERKSVQKIIADRKQAMAAGH